MQETVLQTYRLSVCTVSLTELYVEESKSATLTLRVWQRQIH